MNNQRSSKVHSSARGMRKTRNSRLHFTVFTMLPLALAVSQALANPDGGVVVGGQAAITQRPGVTIVDQASNRTIINWNGFNIDPGELTQFNQPGMDAIALNRVIGSDPSQLLGALKANGHVWLVNQNGILFGPSARVDVHGLLATTADIADHDFLAGRNHFSIPSANTDASVVNQGNISIGEHGLAALVAPHVRNAGIIQGKMGQVVIAGVPTFTLDFYGDGLIQFQATSKVTENANPDDPLVRNNGTISVDGGNVLITANAAAGIVDETINMDGIIEARSVGMVNGAIVLMGGDDGLVRVAGSLDASGRDAGETGGTVKVLGEKVALYVGTRIDASGDTGGGEVLIGGNFQGKGAEPNAKRTYVASGASIDADAVTRGDGGKVTVWADEITGFAGDISATGGIHDGDGGFVEVSGKQDLTFKGTVDLSANNGRSGTLLLDPQNIDIVFDGGEGAADDIELIDNEILFGDSPGATFTISETFLESLAADANIILEATNNITIEQLFNDNTLNFQATTGSVTFRADGIFTSQGADIETQGGNVSIEAGSVAGTSMEIRSNGGNISLFSRNGTIPSGLFLFTDASSTSATGGDITIEAQGDVFLGGRPQNIDTSGPLGGGSVTITSNQGTVDFGNLNASSTLSNGGEVTINAFSNIFTGAIDSSGASGGGNVTFTSATGAIATDFATEGPPLNPIDSSSSAGSGGSVDLTAPIRISVGAINTSGALASGDITLESDQLDLTGGTNSILGPGADLLIQPSSTNQSIVIASVGDGELELTPTDLAALADGFNTITIGRADGVGTITVDFNGASFSDPLRLQSPGTGGTIRVNGLIQMNGSALSLISGSLTEVNANIQTTGGALVIDTDGSIDTTAGELNTATNAGDAGTVHLEAVDNITTSSIFASSLSGNGGDITVTSSSGAIDTTRGRLDSTADSGDAGTIALAAATTINTGNVASNSNTGLGGAVNLGSIGDIATGAITFGSLSALSGGALTANSSGIINLAALAPNGADTAIGAVNRPNSILLPDTVTTSGGSVTLFVADAYSFASTVTTDQGNFSLDGLQAITLAAPIQTNGGNVTVQTGAALTLAAPIAASVDQAVILLVADGGFTNQVGENGLQPGDGRYLVYSSDPADDTRGIPDDQFDKRYNFPFDPDAPLGTGAGLAADGNFFLYEISPTLTLVADNASREFAQPDPEFTYTFSGLIDGDSLETAVAGPPILTTTAVVTSFPGDYPIEIDPDLFSTLGYTVERVAGNLTVTESTSGINQYTTLLLPTIPLDELLKPVVPLVLTEQPDPTFAVPEIPSVSESSGLLSPNDGNRELWGTSR